MVRSPSFDKNGLKKGAWSVEEDKKLRAYVERYGHWNWRELPKFAGLRRCGKSCRLRWLNYLKPDVKRGNYSENEEDLIIKLHEQLGNKWSTIASHLPGRTDNEIKNYWHSHLKKRVEANSSSSKTEEQLKLSNTSSNQQSSGPCSIESSDHGLWTSSMDSGTEDSAGSSEVININNQHLTAAGDFWSQPFLTDNIFSMLNMDISSPNLETTGLPSPYASCSYYDDVGIDLFNQLWTAPDLPGSY